MSNNKVRSRMKQQELPHVTPGDPRITFLAEAILDIVDWLCSEDRDVEKLVNDVKPKAEAVLRNS